MKKILGSLGLVAVVAVSIFLIAQGGDSSPDPIAEDAVVDGSSGDTGDSGDETEAADTEADADASAATEEEQPTTTAAPQTSTTEADVAEGDTEGGPAFDTDIEVGQLGETFLRFRFVSSESTPYTVVVKEDGQVVSTSEGSVRGGELEANRIDGLEPGRTYTAQITLIGPPSAQSHELIFRTDGGVEDASIDAQTDQVEFIDLTTTWTKFNQAQFDYKSNVCANGSFVVIEQATGEEVGRNDGHPNGCVDKHLAIPGRWTSELKPETTYLVIISLEANGFSRGRQYGNVTTETIEITTPPRPTPNDPVERTVADVEFVSMEQMETSATTVRIDYETNVCTNGSFVVREVGGDEVGRHDGSTRGCSTTHSAIPGLWTDELEPDTSYVVVISAEADGAGQGDGNIATDSITVRTEAADASTVPANPVEISSVDAEIDTDGRVVATVLTSACTSLTASVFEQAGALLGTTSVAECAEAHTIVIDPVDGDGNPVTIDGGAVLVVTVTAASGDETLPDRASSVTILN